MKNLLDIQRKVIPEALLLLEKRYSILKEISFSGTVGRRMLAQKMNLSERIVRSEVDFLKEEGLLSIHSAGMDITPLGMEIVERLSSYISQIRGLSVMQELLREKLSIKEVIIAPTSLEINKNALRDLGKEAGKYFLKHIEPDSIVGLTGGYTMYEFSQQMPRKDLPNMYIVPARGGLGEVLEIQANTIVAHLASRLNAKYKLLQIPDSINKEIIEHFCNDPQIRSVYEYIERLDFLVFGIGNAQDMSIRRNISSEHWDDLEKAGAVSESFGHYFDINGEIVFETGTVGIKLEQYKKMQHIIGIAGGKNKAEAILSISKINPNLVLVTDESAAYSILDRLNK
ncbi:MAG: sugar-binding domain-containing protein [Peptostreptococcaceae bacterium]|nr:sugar-binding domain-containing protein [Peptostreptococcaceae bacterium]